MARGDYYRIQMQLLEECHKYWWATYYNFIADTKPENARLIRNHAVSPTITRLREVVQVMKNDDPNFKKKFDEWLKENAEPDVIKEFKEKYDIL